MMCLQLTWVSLMVPETREVCLEDMQKKLGTTQAAPRPLVATNGRGF